MENISKTSKRRWPGLFFRTYILPVGKNRYFILSVLFSICSLFYYFGELVNLFGWVKLEWSFFYAVHDVHRLLFFIPIIYAAFYFGPKMTLLVSACSLVVFIPRAILVSPYPDPIVRAVIFGLVETAIGLLISLIRNKQGQPESTVHNQSTGSLLGGTGRTIESEEFAFGDCTFNLSAHVIKRRGHIVKFTQTEYKLLAFLVRNRGKVLGHQEILHSVWGAEYTEAKEDLRTFIAQLRKKLEDDPSNPKFIITEQGVGYRFQENEEFIKHSLIPF